MNSAHLSRLYLDKTPVRLTKLSTHRDHVPLLPTSYWAEGVLQKPIFIGENINLLRYRRSRRVDDPEGTPEAVELLGLFETSQIIRIQENLLYTQNSIWQIEEVKSK